MDSLTQQEQALLRKRKTQDLDKTHKWELKARHKLANARAKKDSDKKAQSGGEISMPEVFVSNYMKQQRNFVKYRRQKKFTEEAETGEAKQSLALPKS